MKKRNITIAVVIIAVIVLVVLFLSADAILKIKSTQTSQGDITDFESCINAGNPAMESYPRQCRDSESGRTFTEIIEEWRADGIELRRHESDFSYGCFGCSNPKDDGTGLCIDPVKEMKYVPETKNLHCNENFEVVKNESAAEELGNIGETCLEDSECVTPIRYLIQSNCAFASECIENTCRVVCPLTYHDLNPEISKSYPYTCEDDDDCNCDERTSRTISCTCHDGNCVSVEE